MQVWKIFLPSLRSLSVICLAVLRLPGDGIEFASGATLGLVDFLLFLFGQLLIGNKLFHRKPP